MELVSEYEVFAEVINETVNPGRLGELASHSGRGRESYSDCEEYVIDTAGGLYGSGLSGRFGITEGIIRRWNEERISFSVCIYLKEARIVGGHIFKFREIGTTNGLLPAGYETEPTLQELRIVRRILSYVTEGE